MHLPHNSINLYGVIGFFRVKKDSWAAVFFDTEKAYDIHLWSFRPTAAYIALHMLVLDERFTNECLKSDHMVQCPPSSVCATLKGDKLVIRLMKPYQSVKDYRQCEADRLITLRMAFLESFSHSCVFYQSSPRFVKISLVQADFHTLHPQQPTAWWSKQFYVQHFLSCGQSPWLVTNGLTWAPLSRIAFFTVMTLSQAKLFIKKQRAGLQQKRHNVN